ncbi:MAG: signal peptidase I [Egibacteraceae bacterium]
MRHPRLVTLALGVAVSTAAVVVLAGLPGALTVVITHGNSMEPTYRSGDVVVVRRADHYAVGDIAAYRSPTLGQVVLHRIVDTDGDAFVLSGDNNAWLDPERPRTDELLGTAWVHLPTIGVPARWLRAHPAAMVLAVLAALAAAGTSAARKRNRPVRTPASTSRGGLAVGAHAQLGVALLVGLVAFAVLAAVSWTRPATAAGEVAYTHDGTFTHTATAAPGPVYETAKIDTAQPLFLRLVRDLEVGFAYRFTAEEPATTHGTIALHATVDHASGWSRTIPLADSRSFEGATAQITGGLDIGEIRSLVDTAADATGEPGGITITVRPQVHIDGDIHGQPLDERFAPTLAYQLTDTQLRPVDGGDSGDAAPFTAQEAGQVPVPGSQPATLSWAGRAIPVPTARWLSLAAALTCVAGLLGLLVASWRTARLDEAERIMRRWPHLVISADVEPLLPARVVGLTDITALVALAQANNRPVLHDRATKAFICDLDGTHYHYRPAATPAPTPAPSPEVPPAAVPPVADPHTDTVPAAR